MMDEFYPLARTAYTLEEFCLAVAAYRKMELAECTDVIHHYWSRKAQFRAKIQAWLGKHGHDPLGPAALADVALVNDQLPRPPALQRLGYKALSLTMPSRERQFVRELLYGCYPTPTSSIALVHRPGGTRRWRTSTNAMGASSPSNCVSACATRAYACHWAAGARISRRTCCVRRIAEALRGDYRTLHRRRRRSCGRR